MAGTFPSPAAGCPMAPTNGRWSPATEPDHLIRSFSFGDCESMARRLLRFCLGMSLLTLAAAPDARAVEIPVRKAGLWELKMVKAGSPLPEMTMQHCTDETSDK